MVDKSVQGHRARLKQRFTEHGLDGFHEYEVLELLLTYAIPRKDVKPVAKRLMVQFQTLAGVFDAQVQELQTVEGLGKESAQLLKLLKAAQVRYLESELASKPKLDSPETVKAWLRLKLQEKSIEYFGALFTDQQNQCISTEILFEGTVDRAVVYPRTLIKRALELDAKGLIIFHNHPAGTALASEQDIALTRQLIEACNTLDIKLLDHFLLAGTQVLSFQEQGWWPQK
ncbi:RadC family protein [Ghiorsea bivora]|uniref:RadC family protein n=1 Tax=Ghiorsea bivora TaxID=1485545 RepID=UPI000570D792|nr:DNA repair protein RadC [Ghiorsea bivora]